MKYWTSSRKGSELVSLGIYLDIVGQTPTQPALTQKMRIELTRFAVSAARYQ